MKRKFEVEVSYKTLTKVGRFWRTIKNLRH